MMRQIDADALNERIDRCVGIDGLGLEPLMAIRDIKALISVMPSIDAIPVEWLREKMNLADDAGDLDSVDLFSWIIQTWQKEQEAR